jgi:hypothetical protein
LTPLLDERSRRLLVAAESQVIGRSGTAVVSKVTGVSRRVIRQGMAELKDPVVSEAGRVRRPGGGRKKAIDKDPARKHALEELLESTTRGEPEALLRWTWAKLLEQVQERPQAECGRKHGDNGAGVNGQKANPRRVRWRRGSGDLPPRSGARRRV